MAGWARRPAGDGWFAFRQVRTAWTPGDPEFPYVGEYVNTLALAQVRTLNCGSKTLADRPGQLAVPGARMPLLSEVFALVKRYRALKNAWRGAGPVRPAERCPRAAVPVRSQVTATATSPTTPSTGQDIRPAAVSRQRLPQSWGGEAGVGLTECVPGVSRSCGRHAGCRRPSAGRPRTGTHDSEDRQCH
ncbi:hypothetical protein Abr02nite_54270 [Paractinoplanes brasiliensis]|nr:hypothetical protein Abr02nite_54270 [Actinoplanes brasiliensis]